MPFCVDIRFEKPFENKIEEGINNLNSIIKFLGIFIQCNLAVKSFHREIPSDN